MERHITHYNKKKNMMECSCGYKFTMEEGLLCPKDKNDKKETEMQ